MEQEVCAICLDKYVTLPQFRGQHDGDDGLDTLSVRVRPSFLLSFQGLAGRGATGEWLCGRWEAFRVTCWPGCVTAIAHRKCLLLPFLVFSPCGGPFPTTRRLTIVFREPPHAGLWFRDLSVSNGEFTFYRVFCR